MRRLKQTATVIFYIMMIVFMLSSIAILSIGINNLMVKPDTYIIRDTK